jgi:tetratricopeptide (TPR) repeat protein
MGELLFCNEPIAAMPYYVEGISWNIYSLEELCFYIENNPYLIDRDFMNEELCTWIGKEIKNIKLAESLRDIMRMEGKLSEFVLVILVECGYTAKNKIGSIIQILQEMEEKSDFERNKLRADRLMDKEKYLGSIYEYKRLLEASDAFQQTPQILGNIWHNLGTAYARLFLFKEAIHCYENAYKLNENEESLKECLFAYRCIHDEIGFLRVASQYGLSQEKIENIRVELSEIRHGEEIMKFEERLETIGSANDSTVNNIIFNWKEEYRRISRI